MAIVGWSRIKGTKITKYQTWNIEQKIREWQWGKKNQAKAKKDDQVVEVRDNKIIVYVQARNGAMVPKHN